MLKIFRMISWLLYILGIGIFIINLITLEYSGFLSGVIFISFGILIVDAFFMMVNKERQKRIGFTCGLKNRTGRIICGIIGIFSLAIPFVVMICAIIYGGSPDIVDGVYCITYRNDFVRELTFKEYNMLYLLEQEVFPCFSILCNTIFLGNSTLKVTKK